MLSQKPNRVCGTADNFFTQKTQSFHLRSQITAQAGEAVGLTR